MAETQPKLQPAWLKLSAMIFQSFTRRFMRVYDSGGDESCTCAIIVRPRCELGSD
jgi:hypothetical protein